jgi:hypothetical protein
VNDTADRRSHPRRPCLVKVALRQDDRTWYGTILDYSDGGVYVASSTTLKIGDKLRLRFRQPVSGRIADLEGEVKRLVPRGDPMQPEQGYGVHFIELLKNVPDASGASGVFPAPQVANSAFASRNASGSSSSRVTQLSASDVRRSPLAGARSETRAPAARRPDPRTEPSTPATPSVRARANRSVVEIDVTVLPHTGSVPPFPGRGVNISKGGMFLATDQGPPNDTVMTVSFDGAEVDGGPEALDIVVQVTWHSRQRPHQDLPLGVGCRIIGFHSNEGRHRFEKLLRALLVIGNPIFRTH